MKSSYLCIFFLLLLLLLLVPAYAGGGHSHLPSCKKEKNDAHDHDGHDDHDEHEESDDEKETRRLRIVGIFVVLVAGALGVLIPIMGRWISFLRPERDIFVVVKAFAAGVILSTALIHILPESFERLGSDCLKENPWHEFPFAGFIAMLSALGTMMVDSLATGYYTSRSASKAVPTGVTGDVEKSSGHDAHVHSHGVLIPTSENGPGIPVTIRQRITAQVLELGIVVHSVIIGVSLGASESLSTIRPLIGALAFHQFFEGMGLGSCIAQANFKTKTVIVMSLFFSLTTPIGIAIGIGVSSSYHNNGTTALIVEGVFDAAAAGILIYLSLVDLLAADFMSDRLLNNKKLQFWSYIGLLLGAGAMSALVKWE